MANINHWNYDSRAEESKTSGEVLLMKTDVAELSPACKQDQELSFASALTLRRTPAVSRNRNPRLAWTSCSSAYPRLPCQIKPDDNQGGGSGREKAESWLEGRLQHLHTYRPQTETESIMFLFYYHIHDFKYHLAIQHSTLFLSPLVQGC